jgi:hypothetical protein
MGGEGVQRLSGRTREYEIIEKQKDMRFSPPTQEEG